MRLNRVDRLDAMSQTEFILTRHGETTWNLEGRIQGSLETDLTEAGVAQAKAFARRVSSFKIDAIYSSNLLRARETARPAAESTGHTVVADARLRERDHGIFQGLTLQQVEAELPDEYRLYKTGPLTYVIPGGESIMQVFERSWQCLQELAVRHEGGRVVVVTHGGVLGVIFRHVLGIPLNAPRRFKVYNAALNVLLELGGRWMVQTLGDITHLATLEPHLWDSRQNWRIGSTGFTRKPGSALPGSCASSAG